MNPGEKGSLKVERVHRTAYPTRAHAYLGVARYVELRYTQRRLHSSLEYRTPNEVETELLELGTAA